MVKPLKIVIHKSVDILKSCNVYVQGALEIRWAIRVLDGSDL